MRVGAWVEGAVKRIISTECEVRAQDQHRRLAKPILSSVFLPRQRPPTFASADHFVTVSNLMKAAKIKVLRKLCCLRSENMLKVRLSISTTVF